MTDTYGTRSSVVESGQSAVSWAAIAAGGVAAASLSLILLAFGSAMGFSSVSPWSGSSVSPGTFRTATGIYLVVMAMLGSTVGGYIAGRLRTKWNGLHSEEVLFRDTAHGFLAWAFAAVLGAAALGAAATFLASGAAVGASQGAAQGSSQQAGPQSTSNDYFTDMLFRPAPGAAPAAAAPVTPGAGQGGPNAGANERREARTILARSVFSSTDVPQADRTYLAQLVSTRTGLPQPDAEKRVNDVTAQAKSAAEEARKTAAHLSMWLAISMLVGAFSASLAAIEGGQLRDGTWKGVIGGSKYRSINS